MNKLQIFDRVKSTATAATATGNIDLDTVVDGFQMPNDTGASQGLWWPMLIEDTSTGDWEVGFYQEQSNFNTEFGRSGNQVVLASSNAGSAVSFSTTAEALTVSVIDPALFVESPERYVDITSGSIDRTGALYARNDSTTRFPLISTAFAGHVQGLAAQAALGTEGHVEQAVKTITTTDATATAVMVFEIPSAACVVAVQGIAVFQDGSGNSRVQKFEGCAHYDGTTAELLGTPTVTELANDSGVTAAISMDYSSGLRVVATGEAATTFTWGVNATATYVEV